MSKLLKLILVLSTSLLLVINYTIIFTPSSVIAIEGIVPEDAPIILPSEESETPADDVGMPEFPENADTDSSGSGEVFFSDSFKEYLPKFYLWALVVGGALSVAVLIWAGFDYATSAGNVDMTNQAKEKIVGAILGLLILILAALILRALGASS